VDYTGGPPSRTGLLLVNAAALTNRPARLAVGNAL
jgi:hypothetical protein